MVLSGNGSRISSCQMSIKNKNIKAYRIFTAVENVEGREYHIALWGDRVRQ